jgi:hypothetical protein
MPTELIKDFIDNEQFKVLEKIIGTEVHWIKIQEKDSMRIVNGAMVRDIKINNKLQ